jgi:hypothetical protein
MRTSWKKTALVMLIGLVAIGVAGSADETCDPTDLVFARGAIAQNDLLIWVSNPTEHEQTGHLKISVIFEGEQVTFGVPLTVTALSTVTVHVWFPTPYRLLGVELCGGDLPYAIHEAPDPIIVRLR